jgi:hypothetical protein
MHGGGIFAEFQLIHVALNEGDTGGVAAVLVEIMRQHFDEPGLTADGAAAEPTKGDEANEEKRKSSHGETLAATGQNSMPRY